MWLARVIISNLAAPSRRLALEDGCICSLIGPFRDLPPPRWLGKCLLHLHIAEAVFAVMAVEMA